MDVGIVLAVPAAALLEAWAQAPPGGRPFLELLLADRSPADAAAAGAGPAAAQTVAVAQRRGWPVVTVRPEPLRFLAADIELELLP